MLLRRGFASRAWFATNARGHARDTKAPRNRIGIQSDACQLKVTVNPATLTPWSAHDTQLLIACGLGLAIIIVSISVLRLAPFLSILVGTRRGFLDGARVLPAHAQAHGRGVVRVADDRLGGGTRADARVVERADVTTFRRSARRFLAREIADARGGRIALCAL
ncbi:protein of unknown function (plasmid) [Caballeronia sp. S22]